MQLSYDVCFVARGLASRLRLKYVLGVQFGGPPLRRQGPGISSEIEISCVPLTYIYVFGVARGLASRLRLKYLQQLHLLAHPLRRQGPGISSEIEISFQHLR